MKKIIFPILFCFLTFNFTNAQDIQNQEEKSKELNTPQNNLNQMPSDKEIMDIIESYHLNESQKKQVFKETKKRLQESLKEGN